MVSLMQRRREMMQAAGASPLPEWDCEWNYTMGLPTTVAGFSLLSSGTGSATMTDNGLYLRAANSAYRLYTLSDYGCTTGVLEAKLMIPTDGATSNRAFGFLQIGNTTESLRTYFYHTSTTDKLRLDNGSELKNGTGVFDFSYDTEMTVRLEIENGIGQIYLNDEIKKSNIALSSLKTPKPPRFGAQNGGSGQSGAVWKSVKFKIGRL